MGRDEEDREREGKGKGKEGKNAEITEERGERRAVGEGEERRKGRERKNRLWKRGRKVSGKGGNGKGERWRGKVRGKMMKDRKTNR